MYSDYHHKLLLFVSVIIHVLLIDRTTSHIIAIDTSEITERKELAIPDSSKLNVSIEAYESNTILKECISMKTDEGIYSFQSDGSGLICGLYMVAKPNYNVEFEFLQFDVGCAKNGLLSVIDGWELNGQFFPGIDDHQLPRNSRYHEFCGHIKPRKTFKMSQNVGLIEYRIPNAGQGFMVRVRFVENPRPCNVIIQDLVGIYTIRNYGRRINCTVSIILEASFQILSMNIGQSYRPLGNLISLRNYVVETGIIKKCKKRGMEDYVELLGGNNLDPYHMTVFEDMCGLRSFSFKKKFKVTCPHTAIRLVSSGQYDNLFEFTYKADDSASPLECPN